MMDERPATSTRPRRLAASVAAAAVAGAALAPALATGPAAAQTCRTVQPYGASASADLLKLSALDLRPLGLGVGPVADVSVATTGSGMAADAEVASAAASRGAAADLLGLDAIGLVPVGDLGHVAYQEAPPTNPAPASRTGLSLDLGLLDADISNVEAHATWDEGMRCGDVTGTASGSSASLVDAAVLPGPDSGALVSLPDNLASRTGTGLVEQDGNTASRARAAASLADVRLLAGSTSEIAVKVISEPALEVVATGDESTSSVTYQAPLLEISGPGGLAQRLEAPGEHVDIAMPTRGALDALGGLTGSLPVLGDGAAGGSLRGIVGGLVDGPNLGALSSGGPAEAPLELAGLPGVGDGQLPVLSDVLSLTDGADPAGLLPDLDGLSVLRLSLGDLRREVTDGHVNASAAALRLQVLTWNGDRLTERAAGTAVVDLGIGLLQAAATAPPPPEQPPEEPGGGGGCGDCGDDERLPVTGSTAGIIVGAGTLLAVAGRFLLLVARRATGP